MSRVLGGGACCLPGDENITYLHIGPDRIVHGMMGLDTVFEQLYAKGRRPEGTTDAEIVGMARKFNYIPIQAAIETDHAVALREAYARFCADHGQEPAQPVHVEEREDLPRPARTLHRRATFTRLWPAVARWLGGTQRGPTFT